MATSTRSGSVDGTQHSCHCLSRTSPFSSPAITEIRSAHPPALPELTAAARERLGNGLPFQPDTVYSTLPEPLLRVYLVHSSTIDSPFCYDSSLARPHTHSTRPTPPSTYRSENFLNTVNVIRRSRVFWASYLPQFRRSHIPGLRAALLEACDYINPISASLTHRLWDTFTVSVGTLCCCARRRTKDPGATSSESVRDPGDSNGDAPIHAVGALRPKLSSPKTHAIAEKRAVDEEQNPVHFTTSASILAIGSITRTDVWQFSCVWTSLRVLEHGPQPHDRVRLRRVRLATYPQTHTILLRQSLLPTCVNIRPIGARTKVDVTTVHSSRGYSFVSLPHKFRSACLWSIRMFDLCAYRWHCRQIIFSLLRWDK